MFFKVLLMLKICLPNKDINLEILSESIGIITCCLEGSFVVILILSFTLSGLLIVLCIFSIFFKEMLGKLSLIFNIFLTLGDEAWAYECLFLLFELLIELLPLFWKNFDFLGSSYLAWMK